MAAVAPTLLYDLTTVDVIGHDLDWATRWADVTVPTLVLSGDQTFPGLSEAADAVAAALPNANRQVLPGQSHGPAGEVIATALHAFLH